MTGLKEQLSISPYESTQILRIKGKYHRSHEFAGSPDITIQLDLPHGFPSRNDYTVAVIPSGIWYPRTNQLVQFLRETLIDQGIAVVTFDYAGLNQMGGESDGLIECHSLGQMVEDLRTASSILESPKLKNVITRRVLIGPSAGGNVVAACLQSDRHAQSAYSLAVLLGTPEDFLTFRPYFDRKVTWDTTGKIGEYVSSSTGQTKKVSSNIWDHSNDPALNPLDIKTIRPMIWIIGGSEDTIIPPSLLVGNSDNNIIIQGADHNFTDRRIELEKVLLEFVGQ